MKLLECCKDLLQRSSPSNPVPKLLEPTHLFPIVFMFLESLGNEFFQVVQRYAACWREYEFDLQAWISRQKSKKAAKTINQSSDFLCTDNLKLVASGIHKH